MTKSFEKIYLKNYDERVNEFPDLKNKLDVLTDKYRSIGFEGETCRISYLEDKYKREFIFINPDYKEEKYEEEKPVEKLNIFYDSDFKNLNIQNPEWLIQDLIPKNTIVLLGGKRSTFKSFTVTNIAYCLANEKPLFDKFETIKSKILFIDEENNQTLIKQRVDLIKKGLDISDEEKSDIAFSSLENIKLDSIGSVEKLERFVQEYKPNVIIIDSLRRVVRFKENESEPISNLFIDVLKPFSKKYGITWIILHHLRKGISGRDVSDEMDEMRGSSDLPALADIVLILQRNRGSNDSIVFKQVKCRYKQEITPKIIKFEWDPEYLKMTCVGDAEEIKYADEICSKLIINWMSEKQIKSFKTADVIKAMKDQNQTKATIERSLKLLVESGKLIKPQRGEYELNLDTKLIPTDEPSNHQNPQDGNEANKSIINKPSIPSNYKIEEGLRVQDKIKRTIEPSLLLYSEGSEGSDGIDKTPIKPELLTFSEQEIKESGIDPKLIKNTLQEIKHETPS